MLQSSYSFDAMCVQGFRALTVFQSCSGANVVNFAIARERLKVWTSLRLLTVLTLVFVVLFHQCSSYCS